MAIPTRGTPAGTWHRPGGDGAAPLRVFHCRRGAGSGPEDRGTDGRTTAGAETPARRPHPRDLREARFPSVARHNSGPVYTGTRFPRPRGTHVSEPSVVMGRLWPIGWIAVFLVVALVPTVAAAPPSAAAHSLPSGSGTTGGTVTTSCTFSTFKSDVLAGGTVQFGAACTMTMTSAIDIPSTLTVNITAPGV